MAPRPGRMTSGALVGHREGIAVSAPPDLHYPFKWERTACEADNGYFFVLAAIPHPAVATNPAHVSWEPGSGTIYQGHETY